MKDSEIKRGRKKPRNSIKDVEINELDMNMIYDRTL